MGFIADIFTGNKAVNAQKDASRDQIAASERATTQTLALQKEMFERVWQGTAVQRQAGDEATKLMARIMGLPVPSDTPAQPQTLPGSGNAFGGVGGAAGGAGGLMGGNAFGGLPASLNGGKSGLGSMFARMDEGAEPMANGQPAPSFGGVAGQPGAITSAQTGSTTPQPGATEPNAAFDVTAWLRSTPAYQSNLDAGQRQLNHGLASKGRLFSGEAGREAMRYGSDYNDRIFGDQFNRLAAIAGAGQTATSQGAASGANYANQGSQAYQANANRLGSSYQNRGDAISGFWGDMNASWKNTENAFGRLAMGGF